MSKWEMVRLGEVCQFINGDRGKNYPSAKDFIDVGIPFINAGHISEKKIDFSGMNYISKEKYQNLGSGKIKENDIVFCLRGSLGKHAIISTNIGAIASSLVILRSNLSLIYPKYLSYCLESEHFYKQLNKANNGSSQPNLSAASVKLFTIPLPPLETQKQIAKTLDTVTELLAMRKQQLAELDNLIKATFYEMFGDPVTNEKGWDVRCLKDLCNNLDSRRVPITSTDREKGIYPYYGASGVVDYVNDYIFDGTYLLISEDGANLLTRVLPIAFSVFGKVWVNNHAHVLEFKDYPSQVFVEFVINNMDIANYVTGSAQPKLNQAKLNSIRIPLPPLPLQTQFAEIVIKIEEQKALVKKAVDETQTLFDSLMSEFFS